MALALAMDVSIYRPPQAVSCVAWLSVVTLPFQTLPLPFIRANLGFFEPNIDALVSMPSSHVKWE